MIYTGLDFGEFKGESRPASRSQESNKDNNFYMKELEHDSVNSERKISTSPIFVETPNEGKFKIFQ